MPDSVSFISLSGWLVGKLFFLVFIMLVDIALINNNNKFFGYGVYDIVEGIALFVALCEKGYKKLVLCIRDIFYSYEDYPLLKSLNKNILPDVSNMLDEFRFLDSDSAGGCYGVL